MAKNAIDELAVMVTANTAGLTAGLKQAERSLSQFRQDVERASGKAPDMKGPKLDVKQIRENQAHLKSLSASAKETGTSLASMVKMGLVSGGSFLALQAGVSGLTDVFNELKDSVRMAADMEQTTLAFEVMLGSAERAGSMLREIRQYAATTPFNNAEITDASKKLIAYGITANQVVPTIRMLGDVSAATGAPINDIAYLYGTLAAQQRAYTKDIMQFANRGIPIYEELAKVLHVSTTELKDMVEEGKVGFPEVVKAFKNMTEGNGRYAGLTARQGQTTAGMIEQATDAYRQAKMHFGTILIEELGIKDMASDFGGFMQRVKSGLDDLRPAVRFIGDSFKASVQIGHEFGRVMSEVAKNGNAFGEAFPGLNQAAKDLRQLVTDAGSFKLDETQVLTAAMNISVAIAEVFGMISKETSKAALVIYDVVDDIRKIVGEIAAMIDAVNGNNKIARAVIEAGEWARKNNPLNGPPVKFNSPDNAGIMIPEPGVPDQFLPPTPAERPDAIFARAKAMHLEERAKKKEYESSPNYRTRADAEFADKYEENFLDRFKVPGARGPQENRDMARHLLVVKNELPPWNPTPDTRSPMERVLGGRKNDLPQPAKPPEPPKPPTFRDVLVQGTKGDFGDAAAPIRAFYMRLIAGSEQRKLDAATAAELARQKELAGMAALGLGFLHLTDSANALAKAMERPAEVFQPFSTGAQEIAKSMRKDFKDPWKQLQEDLAYTREASLAVTQPSGAGVIFHAPLLSQRERDFGIADKQHQAIEKSAANKGGEDDWAALTRHLKDLQKAAELTIEPTALGMFSPGQISGEQRDRAMAAAIRDAANKAGVDQHYHLPDAVAVGSQEDARIIARFRSGADAPKTMEDLLRLILQAIQAKNAGDKKFAEGFTPLRLVGIGP